MYISVKKLEDSLKIAAEILDYLASLNIEDENGKKIFRLGEQAVNIAREITVEHAKKENLQKVSF